MSITLTIQSDPVPAGFCPIADKDWQSLVALLHASLASDPTINYGPVTPVPEKRGLPWFRTNSADGTPDRWYVFANGIWISRHFSPPGTIIMYRGDPTAINAFDGGNSNAVTGIDGPFWQRVTECDARFPFQAGTLPSGKVVAIGDTGGEEAHILALAETPKHHHNIANPDAPNHNDDVASLGAANTLTKVFNTGISGLAYALQGTTTAPTIGLSSDIGGAADGTTTAHNTMPPFYSIILLERTNRLFFTQNA